MLKRLIIRILKIFFVLCIIVTVICAVIATWYFNRPLPSAINNQVIFSGVVYSRFVDETVPLVIHKLAIDLSNPDIRFFTTPADTIDGFDYTARTTSDFLAEYDLQVAINGDFFDPWFSYTPFNYYPHSGDGVNGRGLSISDGQIATQGYAPDSSVTLYITSDNQVSFTLPDTPVETAISGNVMVVENGVYAITEHNAYLDRRHPRTAIALDENSETLLLFVIDGRQPGYSHGATMPELAEIIISNGGYQALNLDGGGSVAMVRAGEDGNPVLLNSAIHTRIPFRERPVANHFGVYTSAGA